MEIRRYDPVNIDIHQCKELFLEFQKTKDPKLFEMLLLKYDRFIIFSIHKFKKSHFCLMGEDLQDLYQVSIIGFYKAILSVRPHHRVDKLNFRISSYIKKELRMAYDYKKKKAKSKITWEDDPIKKYQEEMQDISLNVIIATMVLTEKERQMLKMRYVEERTLLEIAKEFSMSKMGVSNMIKRILAGLKRKLESEKDSQF